MYISFLLYTPSLFGLSRKRFKNEEGSCSISFLLYTLFYLPCSISPLFYPSCVPNRLPLSRVDSVGQTIRVDSTNFSALTVSQIYFRFSRIDYNTDDSSRIESNRVDSTNFSALSVSQVDFRLVESTTTQTIRIESNRVDSTNFSVLPVSQIYFLLVESTTTQTIRVESPLL